MPPLELQLEFRDGPGHLFELSGAQVLVDGQLENVLAQELRIRRATQARFRVALVPELHRSDPPPPERQRRRVLVLHQQGEEERADALWQIRSEEHTSELQSLAYLVCRLLLE